MSLERFIALLVGAILLAVTVWSARRSLKRGDGAVTTLGVFSFIWGSALLLFAIPLIRYTTTPVGVWLMVYGSIVTFALGALLAERRYRDLPRVLPEDRQRPDPRRLRIAWISSAILGFIGFAAYVHAVDVVVGWRAIIETPEIVRGIQTSSVTFADTYGPWKLLTYFNQVAFVLWTLAMRERIFPGRWRIAWILGPLSLVPFVFTGDRTLIMISLIWAAAFQMMYLPPTRIKRLMVGSVIGVVVLLVVFATLGGRVGKTVDGQPAVASNLTTRAVDPIVLPYLYATGNVPAFAGLVDDPLRPETKGQLTLLSAVKLLHGFNLWGQPPETVGAFYSIPFQTFNNFSWLGIFYSDFGVFGVLLLPFLFAFITSAVVMRAIRRRTLLSVWTSSLLLYCVVFTFDGYKFFDTLVSEYLLLGLVVIPFIRKDLGPREVIRRLRAGARDRPLLAVSIVAITAVLLSIPIAGLSLGESANGLDRSKSALTRTLESAASLSDVTLEDAVYPNSEALASRLHVNDPAIRYVGTTTADAAPADPQTITVYTEGDRLVLRAQTDTGAVIAYDSIAGEVGSADDSKVAAIPGGVARKGEELAVNGDFENGVRGWQITPGEVAEATITEPGYQSPATLEIVGKGEDGTPLMFSQSSRLEAPKGACIKFSFVSRTQDLDRPLLVWGALLGKDGSTIQLIPKNQVLQGIGPGNTAWTQTVQKVILDQPIIGSTLFAADSGPVTLSGTAWVDDISLRRTC